MSKIKNMEHLRDFALETLERLSNGEIDTAQAGVSGKLCESVISTVKTQLEYARMVDEQPYIPFMDSCHSNKAIESKVEKKELPDHSKKY